MLVVPDNEALAVEANRTASMCIEGTLFNAAALVSGRADAVVANAITPVVSAAARVGTRIRIFFSFFDSPVLAQGLREHRGSE